MGCGCVGQLGGLLVRGLRSDLLPLGEEDGAQSLMALLQQRGMVAAEVTSYVKDAD